VGYVVIMKLKRLCLEQALDPCKYRTESQETEDILWSYPLSC